MTIIKTSLIVLAVLVAAPLSGFSQGTVNFQNRSGVGQGKPIYGVWPPNPAQGAAGAFEDYTGRAKLEGSQYTAGLYMEKEGAVTLLATSPFRTGADAGFILGAIKVTVPNTKGGDVVNLQIRVWDSRGSSWLEALQSGYEVGASEVIKNYVLGGFDGAGTTLTQKTLIDAGLESFGLFSVPEPSVLAFGALGLLALQHRRR